MYILLKSCKYAFSLLVYFVRIVLLYIYYMHVNGVQQEQVLTELFHYVNQCPKPDDATSVQSTLNYLEACSKLFENGFLSAVRVRESHQEVLINIQAGYRFFSEWLNSLLKGLLRVCVCVCRHVHVCLCVCTLLCVDGTGNDKFFTDCVCQYVCVCVCVRERERERDT